MGKHERAQLPLEPADEFLEGLSISAVSVQQRVCGNMFDVEHDS
jgi:hypothetical protein